MAAIWTATEIYEHFLIVAGRVVNNTCRGLSLEMAGRGLSLEIAGRELAGREMEWPGLGKNFPFCRRGLACDVEGWSGSVGLVRGSLSCSVISGGSVGESGRETLCICSWSPVSCSQGRGYFG